MIQEAYMARKIVLDVGLIDKKYQQKYKLQINFTAH